MSDFIVDHLGVGIFAVTRDMKILGWNRFMESHSGRKAEDVVGSKLFEAFPDLPQKWLEKKIAGVFALRNFAFTSWQQRPYLFRFPHDRPITGSGIDVMQQNCTLMPVVGENGEIEAVCVTLFDVTDIAFVQLQLGQALVALEDSATRDGLTGVHNRRHLQHRLSEEFARYKRHRRDLSILLFDLDKFKSVNDQHGHLAGDAVLRGMAHRVAAMVRVSDVFCRYGGEEFMLVLPETGLSSAMVVAENVRQAIALHPIEIPNGELQVTVSIGASSARPELASYEALIQEADTALYAAKDQGRNRSVAFQR